MDLGSKVLPATRAPSLTRTTVLGVGWMLGQTVGARVIGFFSQIVLARLLVPEDFAIVALTATVMVVVGSLQNFGIEDILVQRHRSLRFWATPALVISLALGLLTMAVTLAISPFVAAMYDSPELIWMLAIAALGLPIGVLTVVSGAVLRIEMRFGFLASFGTAELLVTQVATIALAAAGCGAFSFIVPGPIVALIRALAFWWVTRPAMGRFRKRQIGLMMGRSGFVFLTKLVNAAVGQGDYFVLGLLAAKPVVGAYYFAFRLALQPVAALAGNFQNVLFSALSRLRNQAEPQREAAMEAAETLAYVMAPISWMIAAASPVVFPWLFGHRWDDAIVLTQILSIALAFDAVAWIAGGLMKARGEFGRAFFIAFGLAPLFFAGVVAGAVTGSAIGVAIGVLVYYSISGFVYVFMAFHRLGVSLRRIGKLCFAPALLSAFAIGLPWEFVAWSAVPGLAALLIIGVAGGALYLLAVWVVARSVLVKFRQRMALALGRFV